MPPTASLSAHDLRDAFAVALRWLETNRALLNAINVYPVPDGDTGTNMLLTLRAALDASPTEDHSVAALTEAMAEGALMGARGNSGVILSQMLRGLADGTATCRTLSAGDLANALVAASRAADAAVGEPVEGTMLTVLRDAAATALDVATDDLTALLDTAVVEADASVERTPLLLPRLREAGVVDAGGKGIAVILQGLSHAVRGTPLPPPPELPTGSVDHAALEHEGHGFCVEYLVRGDALDRESLRHALSADGDSLLVVGDSRALHVHVHVADPGPALSAGVRAGSLEDVKVDNMQRQHERWAADGGGTDPLPELGLVAVASGAGLERAFQELGATVVQGGATANPSAGEILEAAQAAGSRRVFVLPNDPNVVMAAEQAAGRAEGLITVVPARSIAAGLAAAVEFDAGADPDDLARRLAEAATAARCVEVTRAVRDSTVDGVRVVAGEAIAIIDGRLCSNDSDLEDALLAGLRTAIDEGSELVTLFLGDGVRADARDALTARILEAFPGIELEVVSGGQPHYPYVAAIE